jgi:hypothetical protein
MPVTDTSKKVRGVIKRRQEDGQWLCAAPYGYIINKRKEFEIVPTEADIVRRIFQGVRPAAVALILTAGVRMAGTACSAWWTCLLVAASALLVAFLKVSPIWIILATVSVAACISLLNQKKGKR